MIHYVTFDPETGVVTGQGYMPPDAASHVLPRRGMMQTDTLIPDLRLVRVDLAAQKLVDHNPGRILPALADLNSLIARELAGSDFTQLPDAPFDDNQQAAWRVYRQALRDLSQQSDIAGMIDSWPLRPDGVDVMGAVNWR